MKCAEEIVALVSTRDRWSLLIGRSLPGVASQTQRPDRVVIVNDGRPFRADQVDAIRDTLAPTSVDVLENKRTSGAAGAWNTGLAYINLHGWDGYVAILDDDDVWDAGHLEQNESAACTHDASIAVSGLRLIIDGAEQPRPLIDRLDARDFLVGNPGWQGSNTFVRLSLLRQVGGFRDGMPSLNDRDLAIRLLRAPEAKVAIVNQWTAAWHVDSNGGALSTRRSSAKIKGLRWFWHIYGNEMTRTESDAFFARADTLFGVGRDEIVEGDQDRPPHVEPKGDWRD